MNIKDEAMLETIRKMIVEAKKEMGNKKILTEGKTAKEVFNQHDKNLKEYILENVLKTLSETQK